jgi:alkylation response protein AidB-like acyl-CoA dehydrogenase
MEFGISAEQRLLTDSVVRFLRDQAPLARVRRAADDGQVADLIAGITELGLPALLIEDRHGGVGLTALDACLVAEVLGYHVAPVPYVANSVMAPSALRLAGSPAQQAEFLPKIAGGAMVFGAALAQHTGARAGTGIIARNGRLTGATRFVLDFAADAYIVADSDAGLHIVLADAPGLVRRSLETIDRTRPIGELVFTDTPADQLPRSAGALATILGLGRVVLGADTLGAAQYMLDQAVDYAKQRQQFGRPIGSFQAVKHMCAEMAANLEPTRAFMWYAGNSFAALPDEAPRLASHFKAHISEVGTFVAKTATEVHGGMGFTDLVGLHYWFKRIGFNRQLLGSPERLREEVCS